MKLVRPAFHRMWLLPIVVIVGGIAFLLWLPVLVRARVTAAAEARTGLSCQVEHVSLGFGSLELEKLSLHGDGVQVDVAKADADVSLWRIGQGTAAVHQLSFDGVEADIDIASPGWKQLLTKLRGSPSASTSAARASERVVDVSNAHAFVHDGVKALLNLDGAEAHVDATQIALGATSVTAGSAESRALATLKQLDVVFERGGLLKLRKAELQEASVELRSVNNTAAAGSTIDASADDSADAHDEGADDDAPDSDPKKPSDPKALALDATKKPASDAPPPGFVAGVLAKLRGSPTETPAQTLMARLADGAHLDIKHARVGTRTAGKLEPILSDVEWHVAAENDNALRVIAKGAAVGGGRLDVDFTLQPKQLQADGKLLLARMPLTLLAPLLPSVPWHEPEHSSIDAELTIKTESLSRVSLEGRAALHDGSLWSARLAPNPVRDIDASLEGKGYWLPLQRRLEIEQGRLGLGKGHIDLKGAVEMTADHYAFDLDAQLPSTHCTDAVRSIPKDLLGDMSLAEWTGSISGELRAQIDSRQLDKTVLDIDVKDRCEFMTVPAMADLTRFQRPFTHSVTEPDGTLFEMSTGPGTENWTPITLISPFFIYAVLAHEDPQFFNHHGFSPSHIRTALIRNLKEKRYAVGASTISMQLVKNVFLRREKTLARKLQEVLLTWWIERVMDKRDSLELYLNVIEYGPSVYGVRNAARHYFNRTPAELSPAEAVFLATILPAPKRYHSFFEKGALSPGWQLQMRQMMQRMQDRGFYTKEAAQYGMQEIEQFKFHPAGSPVVPRVIPGGTAPLPYQGAGAEFPDEAFDTQAPADGFD